MTETISKKKILLTGARSLFTLDLARQLHAQGHAVYAAESSHHHVCRFSNAISKHFIVPRPRFQPKEFVDSLVSVVEKEKIDMVIPSFEEIDV